MYGEICLSVKEVNEYARKLLSVDPLLREMTVEGEISSYRPHSSGHKYFKLKDDDSTVDCVMFRQNAMHLGFSFENGLHVRVHCAASIYEKTGQFQLYVKEMELFGVGDLFRRFEALKRKLTEEGLFAESLKKPIPFLPRWVGLVTSEEGAAIRDMIRILRRRMPNVNILVAPCGVQGDGAKESIVKSIEALNRDGRCDVLLVGRGGGSMEDLWAFNEEIVARAVSASVIPVISCVGHETDFTITDFAADYRAATPSMAAEIAVPVIEEEKKKLYRMLTRLNAAMIAQAKIKRLELEKLSARETLRSPGASILESRKRRTEELLLKADTAVRRILADKRHRLEKQEEALKMLNPRSVLGRGYAYVSGKTGNCLTGISDVETGDDIFVHFADGSAEAKVLKTVKGEER